MTRIRSLSLACASALIVSAAVSGARPHYTGTLRMAIETTPRAIDPFGVVDTTMARQVYPLVFETLLAVNPSGGLRPMLATSWASDAAGWHIRLRRGVRLHDGSLLDAAAVAAVLRTRFPEWRITTADDELTIADGGVPADVPWALAHRGSVIAVRQASGAWVGTGPFRVDRLEPGRLTLAAHTEHWSGRPFLDAIEVDLGRSRAAQLADLELGRLDLASLQPADVRRAEQRQRRSWTSKPLDLIALVFEPHRAADGGAPLRRTVAASFDRRAIARVVAQGQAEPATAVLPAWIGGYTLPETSGPVLTRSAVAALAADQRTVVVRVPAGDAVSRAIADRLAVDAQQAGFSIIVQVPTGGLAPRADARLVRVPVDVTSPDRALAGVIAALGPRSQISGLSPRPGTAVEEVARIEAALAERRVLVPIVHLPEIAASAARVEDWAGPLILPDGTWDLANVWLRAAETAPR